MSQMLSGLFRKRHPTNDSQHDNLNTSTASGQPSSASQVRNSSSTDHSTLPRSSSDHAHSLSSFLTGPSSPFFRSKQPSSPGGGRSSINELADAPSHTPVSSPSPSRKSRFSRRHSIGALDAPEGLSATEEPAMPAGSSSPRTPVGGGSLRVSETKRRIRHVFEGSSHSSKSPSASSPYRSTGTPVSRSSPDVTLPRSPSVEEAFHSFVLPEPLPAGTPTTGKRGILKEGKTPGTGNNVRFFSRDNIREISPAPSPDVSHSSQMFAASRASPLAQSGGSHEDDSFDDETGIDQSLGRGISSSPASSTAQDSPPSQFAHRSQIEAPATPMLMASTMSFLDRVRHAGPSTPNHAAPGGTTLDTISDRSELQDVTLDMLSTSADRAARRSSTTPTRSPGARSQPLFPTFGTSPINRDSPLAAFTSGFLDSPHRLSTIPGSTTPSMVGAGASDETHDASFSSSLASMDFPVPPGDMSNLMGEMSRQPGMDTTQSETSTAGQGDESRTTRGDGERTAREPSPASEAEATARMSSSFPYMSMESSMRSSCEDERTSSNPFRASTSTLGPPSPPSLPIDRSVKRESTMSVASQNTITEAIGYYSQPSTPYTSQRPGSSSTADVTMYHTPAASAYSRGIPHSSSGGDMTVYHTPRTGGSLHFKSISFNTPRSQPSPTSADDANNSVLATREPSVGSFNADLSFARSIVEKGITPGQVGSPSLYAHFDYTESPSAVVLRHKGGEVLLPALAPDEVLALHAESDVATREVIAASQAKYALQLEVSNELQAALGRRDAELTGLKAQMGEVRDLEVRLEAQRREMEMMREERDSEREQRIEVETGLDELKERMESLEVEARDREVRQVGRGSSVEPEERAETESESAAEIAHLRDKLEERELSLWEVRNRLSTQQTELDTARADTVTLAEQVDLLSDQVSNLTERNASLIANVADLEQAKHNPSAESVANEHQVELDALRSKIQELESRLDASRSMADVSSSPSSSPASPTVVYSGPFAVVVAALTRDLTQASTQAHQLNLQALKDAAKIKESTDELENQWKRADEQYDQIHQLEQHRDQLTESLARTEEDMADLERQLEEVSAEKESLLETQDALVEQRDAAIAERDQAGEADPEALRALEEDKEYLLEERDGLVAQRDEAWEERDTLQVRLDESARAVEEVEALNAQRSIDMDQITRLRTSNEELLTVQDEHTAKSRQHQEDIDRLTAALAAKDETLSTLRRQLDEFEDARARAIKQLTLSLEQAQEDGDRRVRDLNRTIKDQTRKIASLEKTRDEERAQYEEAIADRASAEMEAHLSGSRLDADSGELERLSKLIAQLRSEDAKKEVTIMRLTRSKMDLKEELESSEIALESKQQELELVKRKFGVRGVAGSTPAPNRTLGASSATPSTARRTSSVFTPAPPVPPAPSSGMDTPGPLARTAAAARPRSSLAMGTPSVARVGPPRSRSSLGVSSSSQSLAAPATSSRLSSRPSMDGPIASSSSTTASARPRFSLGPAPSSATAKAPSQEDDSPTTLSRSIKSAASSSSLRRQSMSSSASSTSIASQGSSAAMPLGTSNANPQATPRRASLAPSVSRRTSMTPAVKTPGGAMGPPSSRAGGRVMVKKEKEKAGSQEERKEREKENDEGMMLA